MHIQDTLQLSESTVSEWYSLREQVVATMVMTVSTGPVGTFTIEGSNSNRIIEREGFSVVAPEDSEAEVADITSLWYKSTSLTATGSQRSIALSINAPTQYIRVRYVRTSGDGEVELNIAGTSGSFVSNSPVLADAGNSTVADYLGILVSDFVPDNILTPANFETGFRAALAAAYANYDADGYSGPSIVVPHGNWPLDLDNGNFVFEGTFGTMGLVNQGRTPGLRGAGDASSFLMFSGSCAGQGAIEWGIEDGTGTFGVDIRDIALVHSSGAGLGSGIRFRSQALQTKMQNVYIAGFNFPTTHEDGIGLAFDGGNNQHQHIVLQNVSVEACQLGAKFENCIQLTMDQLFVNGNIWMAAVFSNCTGSWYGGTTQGAENPLINRGARWFNGTLHPSVSTGWDVVVDSGTGASLSVSSYGTDVDTGSTGVGTCVVSDLVMDFDLTDEHEGMWLYLDNGETVTADSVVTGLYQISRVLSTTSVEILKGTTHAVTPDPEDEEAPALTWELRASQHNRMSINGFPYHEGKRRCCVFIGPTSPDVYTQWSIDGLEAHNTVPVKAVNCYSLELSLHNIYASGYPHARLKNVGTVFTDHPVGHGPTGIIIDGFTRKGMSEANQIPVPTGTPNQLVTAMGGWSFSAEREDTLTLSTLDVTEWRSVQDAAIKLVPVNATKYCTYDAADTGFDGPVVNIVGGTVGANYKALTLTIPEASLPAGGYFPTLVIVGRLLSATPDATAVRIIQLISEDGTSSRMVELNDLTAGGISHTSFKTFNAFSQPPDLVTATTDPFMIIAGGEYLPGQSIFGGMTSFSSRTYDQVGGGLPLNTIRYTFPAGDAILHLPFEYDATSPFVIAWIGIIPHVLPPKEVEALRAALAARYPLPTV